LKVGVYGYKKLKSLLESVEENIIRLRGTSSKFHLDPEYAKFLGIKDAIDVMLGEGIYPGGRAYQESENFVKETIRQLADEGRDLDEIKEEVISRCRCLPNALGDEIYSKMIDDCLSKMSSEDTNASPQKNKELDNPVKESTRRPTRSPSFTSVQSMRQPRKMTNRGGVSESLDIGEAEVVIAARAFSSAMADQIEKLGRMINEDLVAISDQLAKETSPESARLFNKSMQAALNTQLDSAHETKNRVDDLIAQLAGGGSFSPDMSDFSDELGMSDEMGGDFGDDADMSDNMELDDVEDQEMADPSELPDVPLGRREK
jgi:hypothetical protein